MLKSGYDMPDYVVVSHRDLLEFARECFRRVGVPEEDAGIIADHLVLANLRGVDSHGVIRIPYYIEGVEKGYVRARSEIRILRETRATALIDGGGGLGIPVAVKAIRLGIEKAKSGGIAVVSVRNLGHVGMLAYYTLKITEQKLIGLVTANAPARVAPWGGAEPVFGTNPISFGFPAREKPIIIDMATSVIADFKIKLAALKGEKIPEGVALDKSGKPTVDPKEALEGCLLPFGAYKGYSFSLIVEVLSAVLSGGSLSKQIIRQPSTRGGFFVMILDPTAFRSYRE